MNSWLFCVLLKGQYRQPLNFTLDNQTGARSALARLAKAAAALGWSMNDGKDRKNENALGLVASQSINGVPFPICRGGVVGRPVDSA